MAVQAEIETQRKFQLSLLMPRSGHKHCLVLRPRRDFFHFIMMSPPYTKDPLGLSDVVAFEVYTVIMFCITICLEQATGKRHLVSCRHLN